MDNSITIASVSNLGPGESIASRAAQAQRIAEQNARIEWARHHLPDAATARAEKAEAELFLGELLDDFREVQDRLPKLEGALERLQSEHSAAHAAEARSTKNRADILRLAAANEATPQDLAAADSELEIAKERVRVHTERLTPLIESAQADVNATLVRKREIASRISKQRARLAAADARAKLTPVVETFATEIRGIVERLERGDERDQIIEAICRSTVAASGGVFHRKMLDVFGRSLTPPSVDLNEVTPSRVVREAEAVEDEANQLVEMYVVPGNRYGSAGPGERVMVTADEAALQSRIDQRKILEGEQPFRLGALWTPAEQHEHEGKQHAASLPPPKKSIFNPIVDAVERGLREIRRKAEEKTNARGMEGIARLDEHQAYERASARADREAELMRQISEAE